jgi:hypothetical protein
MTDAKLTSWAAENGCLWRSSWKTRRLGGRTLGDGMMDSWTPRGG